MAGWEQTVIVGNVGKVDELKYTQAGVAVLNFSVAVNIVSGSGDEKTEKVKWYRVAIWRQLAESLAPYIVKGKQVMCVGAVDGHAYKDAQGAPAFSLDLTAREVRLLGSKGESNGSAEDYAPAAPTENIPF